MKVKKNIIVILIFLLISVSLMVLQVYLEAQRGGRLYPSNILFFIILNLNLIITFIFIFLTGRTLFKLLLAKRRGIIGAKFRTKIVMSFMLLTIAPAVLLFLIATGFISKSVETWFSKQREAVLQGALAVAQDYTGRLEREAQRLVEFMIRDARREGVFPPESKEELWKLNWIIKKYKNELGAKAVEIYTFKGNLVAPRPRKKRSFHQDINKKIKDVAKSEEAVAFTYKRYFLYFRPDKENRVVYLVAYKLPKNISRALETVGMGYKDYFKFKQLKNPIKMGYLFIFMMITALIIFASLWFGLQMAKGITHPIEELAKATEEVAKGNYNVRATIVAEDEIGMLVRSFNQMLSEINRNREKLEAGKKFMEAVLENIATGVISIDKEGNITTLNQSAKGILELEADIVGKKYWEVFSKKEYLSIQNMIKMMFHQNVKELKRELSININGKFKTILLGVSKIIKEDGTFDGLVMVFEDITDLIKMQRAQAWEEVARRMAHEIKNPLTPIKLSAQRLKRKFGHVIEDESFEKSVDTIIRSVAEMKRMVDEFYRFAKLPQTSPNWDDLRGVVEEVIELYRSSYKDVEFDTEFSPDFPEKLLIDREQMKRVFINLIDNAIFAMNGKGSIKIKGYLDRERGSVVLEIADTGCGIPEDMKEKVFQPYFSTKKHGTGLGLSIVDRIIADHGGYVRIKDNAPKGTVFVIELPLGEAV